MKPRALIQLLLACVCGATAHGAESSAECPAVNDIQAVRRSCWPAELARADRSLNDAYRKAMSNAREFDRALARKLTRAQRAWVEFRKKQCDFDEARTLSNDHFDYANCMMNLTVQRTRELLDDARLMGPR